jgi:hypothetical protein
MQPRSGFHNNFVGHSFATSVRIGRTSIKFGNSFRQISELAGGNQNRGSGYFYGDKRSRRPSSQNPITANRH